MKVRIKFGKHPYLTEIFDADTEKPLQDVSRLEITLDLNNQVYEARLINIDPEYSSDPEVEGEVVATVTEIVSLSDAVIDSIVHKVERRIEQRLKMSMRPRKV